MQGSQCSLTEAFKGHRRVSFFYSIYKYKGNHEILNWNISVAKSFGTYDAIFPSGSTTRLGSWYTYAQLSFVY
jgi:hypothetical protein